MSTPFAGYAFHLVARYGLDIDLPPNMKVGEFGFSTDVKYVYVGDDTNSPPKILTSKSTGSIAYPALDSIKFRNIEIFEGGKVDGVKLGSMKTASGFTFHRGNGEFTPVRLLSSNNSIQFGSILTDNAVPGQSTLDVTLSDELRTLILGGFNLANIETVNVLPATLTKDPVVRFANALWFWNKNSNAFEYSGIPTITNPLQIPITPGPMMFIDATVSNNQRLLVWNGISYGHIGPSPVFITTEEPPNAAEGAYWKDPDDQAIRLRIDAQWAELETASPASQTALARYTLFESWQYNDEGYMWELFVPFPRYNMRDFDAVPVTTVANDDTLTVANSAPFVVGQSYVVFTENTGVVGTITVLNKPSITTIRATTTFGTTLTPTDAAKIGQTSFRINNDATATVKGQQVYYSTNNPILHDWENAYCAIRRSSNGQGLFRVFYRETGTDLWKEAELIRTQGVRKQPEYSDLIYSIRLNRVGFDTRIEYSGAANIEETVKHIVWYTDPEQLAEFTVRKPSNVTPADQQTGVSLTPTLTGSAYSSMYGLTQAGAHYQISRDQKFFDLVLDTSTEPLVSWAATAGQSAIFNDVIILPGSRTGILVADGGVIRSTTDGAITFANGTSAHSTTDINAVAHNQVDRWFAAGDTGTVQYSSDRVTWTATAGVDGFTGNLFGIAAYGNNVIAVGAGGKILISVNKGVSFTSSPQPGAYSGDYSKVCLTTSGKGIAVGASGAIHTTPDFGVTWMQRTPAGSYSGTFNDVTMTENGYAIAVGAAGEIQTSNDFGATWTKRNPANSYASAINGVALNTAGYAVFVGAAGEIQTSKNFGQTWVKRPQSGGVSTAWRAVAINDSNYAFLAGASGGIQRSFVLEGAVGNTYTVPSGSDLLQSNSVYYWRVRYQDTAGFWSEWSDRTAFVTTLPAFNYIGQPTNVLPANNSTSISASPTLVTTAFTSGGASPDTHSKTQYQVSTTPSFDTTVYSSGDSNDLLSHTVPTPLNAYTTYYWRARHKGNSIGYGPWSIPSKFTTQTVPNAPTLIAPANGATGVSLTPLLRTSNFISIDPNVVHSQSQYQVSTNNTFTGIVYDSGAATDKTQHVVPNGLVITTQYFVRARHKGSSTDWSAWSPTISFTTLTISVNQPTVSVTAISTSSVTLQTSQFSVTNNGNDIHQYTDWEVRTEANGGGVLVVSSLNDPSNLTSITLTGLVPDTVYYARARHKGQNFGPGPYGNAADTFRTNTATGEAIFTSSGVYAFQVPAGVNLISAVVIGGGGVASQGGGGGGALRYDTWAVSPGDVIMVSIGAAGTPQSSSSVSHGGASTVGTRITANGGRGGIFPEIAGVGYGKTVGKGGQGGTGVGGFGGDGGRGSAKGDYFYTNGGGGGAGGYQGNGGDGCGISPQMEAFGTNGKGGGGGGGAGTKGGGTGVHGAASSGAGGILNDYAGTSRGAAHGSPSYMIMRRNAPPSGPQYRADTGYSVANPRVGTVGGTVTGNDIDPIYTNNQNGNGLAFVGFKPGNALINSNEQAWPVGWGAGNTGYLPTTRSGGAVRIIWGKNANGTVRAFPHASDNQSAPFNYVGE